MADRVHPPGWRQLVARLGGPQGAVGVLLCSALPVVPFGLLLSSALGQHWTLLASRRGDVGSVLVIWALVLVWVWRGLRS